jgi:hypothetical protein
MLSPLMELTLGCIITLDYMINNTSEINIFFFGTQVRLILNLHSKYLGIYIYESSHVYVIQHILFHQL